MNELAKVETVEDALAALQPQLTKLREPFPPNQVSKLPKPTKAQTEAVKADFKKGVRCKLCGAWHHPDVVHLDYVGHAALTDRLLDTDPEWTWEPVAFNDAGLPAFDGTGGLWIKLTVCGVTRLGYGHATAKPNQDSGAREKEVIGDALRNAAMRFGAALDLWHKGDLHAEEDDTSRGEPKLEPTPRTDAITDDQRDLIVTMLPGAGKTLGDILASYKVVDLRGLTVTEGKAVIARLQKLADEKKPAMAGDIIDDDIRY